MVDENNTDVFVYGRSDDLIYVDGPFSKEIYANYGEPTYLLFNTGALVEVEYDKSGTWRATLLNVELPHLDSETYAPDNDRVEHDYSEVLRIKSDVEVTTVYKAGEFEVI